MKRLIVVLSLSLALVFSCQEEPLQNEVNCLANVLCTEELRYLTYSPKLNEKPVILDDYYVKNLDNGNVYQSSSLVDHMPQGTYLIISDVRRLELQQSGTVLRFFGIKNGQIFIQKDFVVGHDCCHIVPIEGPFDQEN